MADKKTFILDTNVILHDSHSVFSFEDNDVVIPIVVLEEIDRFKKGDQLKNFHAREFTRLIDRLYTNVEFNEGASLGEDRGNIKVVAGNDNAPEIKGYFLENIADHKILGLAYNLTFKEKLPDVVLVSKDINLRMKAKSVGIRAEDFTTGTIKNVDALYKGRKTIEDVEPELVSRLYQPPFEVDIEEFCLDEEDLIPNEYYILKSSQNSVLARYNPFTRKVVKLEKPVAYGIKPRNSEQTFSMDALLDDDIPIVALSGKAGTGKTLLALACAIEKRKDFTQIFLSRPIIPLSNKDIGYLPGDVKSKLNPYMQPLWDNLKVIKNQYSENDKNFTRLNDMTDNKKLVIEPLAYIRGRTLDKIFFIVDEAQNLTPHEIKTIITRVGEGTKIVFTGDPFQIDTPYLDSKSNGLTYLIDRFKGQKLFAHITLERGERSELAELASDLL